MTEHQKRQLAPETLERFSPRQPAGNALFFAKDLPSAGGVRAGVRHSRFSRRRAQARRKRCGGPAISKSSTGPGSSGSTRAAICLAAADPPRPAEAASSRVLRRGIGLRRRHFDQGRVRRGELRVSGRLAAMPNASPAAAPRTITFIDRYPGGQSRSGSRARMLRRRRTHRLAV